MRHVISALVMNEPGVLANVAGMFAARGFNIDSLVVGRTENPELSRMTIVVTADDITLDQVRKQLGKLIPVVNVHDFKGTAYVERDLLLVTVGVGPERRGEVIEVARVFGGTIVDVSADALVVELTGSEEGLDRFIELMKSYGIRELARTGAIAMARGLQLGKANAAASASDGVKRKRSLSAPAAAALPPSCGWAGAGARGLRNRKRLRLDQDRNMASSTITTKPEAVIRAREVLVAFLITFTSARILVYLIMARKMPDLYLHLGGNHVHHLNYGIFLLSFVGAFLLFARPTGDWMTLAALIYGVGLALTFDEFGMWLHLGGSYWQRASFDAVVIIAAVLSLIAAAPELRRFRPHHWLTALVLLVFVAAFVMTVHVYFAHLGESLAPRFQELENGQPM